MIEDGKVSYQRKVDIDLGDNHTLIFSDYKDEKKVGAAVWHLKPDGTECSGWISFAGRAWANEFKANPIKTWEVVQEDPLTLTPSLLCRQCGDHGYIREGRWVRA